jgi:hypothetical protein
MARRRADDVIFTHRRERDARRSIAVLDVTVKDAIHTPAPLSYFFSETRKPCRSIPTTIWPIPVHELSRL